MKGPNETVIQEFHQYSNPSNTENARSIIAMLGTVVLSVLLLGAMSGCMSIGTTKEQAESIAVMGKSYSESQTAVAKIPQLVVKCEAGCSVTLHREYTVQPGQRIVTNGEVVKSGISAVADVTKSVIPQVFRELSFAATAKTLSKANQTINVSGGSTVDQSNSVNTSRAGDSSSNVETTGSNNSEVTTADSHDTQTTTADSNDQYTESHADQYTQTTDRHDTQDNDVTTTTTTTTGSNNQSPGGVDP